MRCNKQQTTNGWRRGRSEISKTILKISKLHFTFSRDSKKRIPDNHTFFFIQLSDAIVFIFFLIGNREEGCGSTVEKRGGGEEKKSMAQYYGTTALSSARKRKM